MDAPTISAFAAAVAAVVAATVAGIQLYVGRKQADAGLISAKATLKNAQNAGRHTVAEFRQKWIDKVIDTLCDYHAILMTTADIRSVSPEDSRLLASLRTRLEILLNPDESKTVELLKQIDCIGRANNRLEREARAQEAIQVARSLLKCEWVRIKSELQ